MLNMISPYLPFIYASSAPSIAIEILVYIKITMSIAYCKLKGTV